MVHAQQNESQGRPYGLHHCTLAPRKCKSAMVQWSTKMSMRNKTKAKVVLTASATKDQPSTRSTPSTKRTAVEGVEGVEGGTKDRPQAWGTSASGMAM